MTISSTLALADPTGAIQTSYTYEPFGNTTVSGASSANPFQFTSRENDGTGLYFYRARYYSPTFQRFIAQDPIGFAGGGSNFYAYTFDDPMNFMDPSGLGATNWWNRSGGRNPIDEGPTNGNYGGEDWSGGLGPGQLGPPAPPQDSGDECYKAHDDCYDQCNPKNSCHNRDKCKKCNQDLVKCLAKLPEDPKDWPHPPIPGTEGDSRRYRNSAENFFGSGRFDR